MWRRSVKLPTGLWWPGVISAWKSLERAWRKLNLSWGVTLVLTENDSPMDVMFRQDLKQARQLFELKKGDNVVLTGGQINGEPGNMNTIRPETIR